MNHSPKFIGFVQAAALTLYVVLFAITVQNMQAWMIAKKAMITPVVAIILFLLAFIISALICGSIILGYPMYLFFNDKKMQAGSTLLWSAVWLIVFLAVFVFIGLR